MSNSSSVFSQTLQEITTTKLDELSKRYASFEKSKSDLLDGLRATADPIDRLNLLSKGVKDCLSINVDRVGAVDYTRHPGLEKKLKNLGRFSAQARYDPSVSAEMLQTWEASLIEHLDMQSLKFQYASLYGQLVSEWLSKDQRPVPGRTPQAGSSADEAAANETKLEMRKIWENTVFSDSGVEAAQVSAYLKDLFSADDPVKEKVSDALRVLRSSVTSFEVSMSNPALFTKENLEWAIDGLLSSGLLSDDQRAVLKDFKGNQVILAEIADVLNMRVSALDSWSWGDMVGVEQERKISGVYNIHMHEDILQAIFLQLIGVKWSVFFKRAFRAFRMSAGAWKLMGQDVPPEKKRDLKYYLGDRISASDSLRNKRQRIYGKGYFVSNLLGHERQQRGGAEGEEEVDYGRHVPEQFQARLVAQQGAAQRAMMAGQQAMMVQQQQNMQMPTQAAQPRSAMGANMQSYHLRTAAPSYPPAPSRDDWMVDSLPPDDSDDHKPVKKPFALKQEVLHLLSTEIALNTKFHGELTAFHCVFDRWNSLLPHETVLSALEFWGVSPKWLSFFSKFLKAPLKWMDAEPGTPTRDRRRGAPASHSLSDMFSEAVLFGLDFAVNQSTSGSALWRVHDDMWFWSYDHGTAVQAWKTLKKFTAVTGVSIDAGKTGAVRISNDPDVTLSVDESLPTGSIRWGFLVLSPQTGRFEIDQGLVDTHIEELRKQLDKKKSVFSFIQTWNSYAATFFSSNFGIPANCFGRNHVDEMLETHKRIQKKIFSTMTPEGGSEAPASVADYLKKILYERFGAKNIPDGFLYFPSELGGLDLKSPFITLLQIRNDVLKSTKETFAAIEKSERDAYNLAWQAFVASSQRMSTTHSGMIQSPGLGSDKFLTFDEYVQYREEFNFYHGHQVKDAFETLMRKPTEQSIDLEQSPEISAIVNQMATNRLRQVPTDPAKAMASFNPEMPYWRWVMMMYGQEIFARFGGLNIVEPGLLPMGMVSIFKESRVKWSA